eukprot:s3618_g1.t1
MLHPFVLRATRYVVEHRLFTILTTLLTVYALTGDDCRLLFTHQPADPVFDGLTLFCIVVFVLEIVLCMFAKDDYILSFFFFLDIISTITLVIDLTWIADIFQGDEEDDMSSDESVSGTAKIGARTSRVVRVLRLIRIIKLYKAIYEARQLQKKKEELAKQITLEQMYPANDDEDSYDEMEANTALNTHVWLNSIPHASMTKAPGKESRVGKKLSELTTRRVILLVLVMMLVLPYLKVEEAQQFPTSAGYGADIVNQAFDQYLASNSTADKEKYDMALLEYIYYHNWYTKQLGNCPIVTSDGSRSCESSRSFDSHVFWVGFVATNEALLLERLPKASEHGSVSLRMSLSVLSLTSCLLEVSPSAVADMEALVTQTSVGDEAWLYVFGHMPTNVQTTLGLSWSRDCPLQSDKKRRGLSILAESFQEGQWQVDYAVPCPDDLRRAERKKYTPRLNIAKDQFDDRACLQALARCVPELHFAFYFDLRPFVKQESVFNLLTVVFVCIMLLLASIGFTNDANRLVLYPVENMIAKVETIRANPLVAMKVADEEFKEKTRCQALLESMGCYSKRENTEIMETVILEKTIIKLGSLLALGFGEAGANIIEHNMHGVDSACVDAMVEGTRVECIIGATRIRDFSTATEVLQAKVMTFVNQIAEASIVHGVVDEFHGAANKNNGDTFLMIWRVAGDDEKVSKLADMSILAFTRILGAIHRTPVLAAYRGHPGLQQRLGKNCRVNLSSGLHYGWAIEGAVGSEFKIDASYLSPNVSIAETVERATQIYGVSLLVAESVVSICSAPMAAKCRLIDRVIITGSVVPMDLYVIDLDYMSLTVEPPLGPQRWTTKDRFKVRQFLENEKDQKLADGVKMVNLFNENADIASMRFRYTLEFIHVFNMGYQNYSQGEWQVAQRMLARTRDMLGDGPSIALLKFMERTGFEAPDNWMGIRDLGHASLSRQKAHRQPTYLAKHDGGGEWTTASAVISRSGCHSWRGAARRRGRSPVSSLWAGCRNPTMTEQLSLGRRREKFVIFDDLFFHHRAPTMPKQESLSELHKTTPSFSPLDSAELRTCNRVLCLRFYEDLTFNRGE